MENETIDGLLGKIKKHTTIEELCLGLDDLQKFIEDERKVHLRFYGVIKELNRHINHPTNTNPLGPMQNYTIDLFIEDGGPYDPQNFWKKYEDIKVHTRKCNIGDDGGPVYGIIKTFNRYVEMLDFSNINNENIRKELKIYAQDRHNPLLRDRFNFIVYKPDEKYPYGETDERTKKRYSYSKYHPMKGAASSEHLCYLLVSIRPRLFKIASNLIVDDWDGGISTLKF